MRKFNPRSSNPQPRWRRQDMQIRNPRYVRPGPPARNCSQCKKVAYPRIEDAMKAVTEILDAYGEEQYIYRAHGTLHLSHLKGPNTLE